MNNGNDNQRQSKSKYTWILFGHRWRSQLRINMEFGTVSIIIYSKHKLWFLTSSEIYFRTVDKTNTVSIQTDPLPPKIDKETSSQELKHITVGEFVREQSRNRATSSSTVLIFVRTIFRLKPNRFSTQLRWAEMSPTWQIQCVAWRPLWKRNSRRAIQKCSSFKHGFIYYILTNDKRCNSSPIMKEFRVHRLQFDDFPQFLRP